MTVKHAFSSGKPDSADSSLVNASNWNAAHLTPPFVYPLIGGRVSVTPPAAKTELDAGAYRTHLDCSNLLTAHLAAMVAAAASAGTTLALEYSTDQSVWVAFASPLTVAIDATGVKVGSAITLPVPTIGPVYLRVVTTGGDNSTACVLGAVTLQEGGSVVVTPPTDFLSDAFTDTAGIDLTQHPATGGGAWLYRPFAGSPIANTGCLGSQNNGTSCSPSRISVTNGRLLIAAIIWASGAINAVPSGWTLIDSQALSNGSTLYVYWRVTSGADPTSWAWGNSVSGRVAYLTAEFSGVDTTAPVDIKTKHASASSSASVVGSGLTPSYAEDMLLMVAGAAAVETTITKPTGFTLPTNGKQAAAAVVSDALMFDLLSSMAATGDQTATWATAADNAAQMIALKNASSFGFVISDANRIRGNGGAGGSRIAYHGTAISSADYSVDATIKVMTDDNNSMLGVIARAKSSEETYYGARYNTVINKWQLFKSVFGTITTLGTDYSQTFSNGDAPVVKLTVAGTSLTLVVDGVSRVTATDSDITDAGYAGISGAGGVTNSTGLHLDTWAVQV